MHNQLKVAAITGAGSGIGRAAALALQRDGWHVAIAGRRAEELKQTISLAAPEGGKVIGVPTNVCDPSSVEAFFKATTDTFGRLDILFNNAGRGNPSTPLEDLPLEQWRSVIDTNLTGAFVCAQHAIRIMKSQSPRGGRIINNGSVSAHAPRPNSAPYTCSKHAISGLTKCIALDGRAHDITASQIDIGNADTEMGGKVRNPVPQANGTMAPEPVMDVEHVAKAIVYIANLHLGANVLFMTLMATQMPLVGRG
jgi:NAD(P)-dependent dehydrogenase (short-subunit alcohol dehydrogenase family)